MTNNNTNPENLKDLLERIPLEKLSPKKDSKTTKTIIELSHINDFKQETETESLAYQHSMQNLEHKEDMYKWIKKITENFLIIILILCSFLLFQVRQEFFENDNNKYVPYFQNFIWFTGFALVIVITKLILNHSKNEKINNIVNCIFNGKEKINIPFNVLISISLFMAFGCVVNFKDLETLQTISPIIITIFGSTTATIIGLPFVVAKYTFKAKEDEDKTKEDEERNR